MSKLIVNTRPVPRTAIRNRRLRHCRSRSAALNMTAHPSCGATLATARCPRVLEGGSMPERIGYVRQARKGERIVRQGDSGSEMFVIQRGEVEIRKHAH